MKGLFLGLPLHGHTNPALSLVRELVGRGETITCYSAGAFAERIGATGAEYRPYRNGFLSDLRELPGRLDALSWLLMRTTAEVLDRELDDFRAERPDYLIIDSVAPWGRWVGEILGVPVVTSVTTFAINRRVLAFGVKHGLRPKSVRLIVSKLRHIVKAAALMKKVRRRYRVKGPGLTGLVFAQSNLNIVYTSRQFQPCADTFDDRFVFIGPSMAPRPEAAPFDWGATGTSDVVYVSLGTLFNTDETFYRTSFEAFQREPWQIVMSIGTNISQASLGTPPPNVIVHSYVPQLEVLGRAAAFVTHGGMNSVSESLGLGVPVVVIPQTGEQEIVGRRVEELGAGVYLAKRDVTAQAMRDAVSRLLTEHRFRAQAAVVRAGFRSSGGVARGADAIVAFTRAGGSVASSSDASDD